MAADVRRGMMLKRCWETKSEDIMIKNSCTSMRSIPVLAREKEKHRDTVIIHWTKKHTSTASAGIGWKWVKGELAWNFYWSCCSLVGDLSFFYQFVIKDTKLWAREGVDLWRFWSSLLISPPNLMINWRRHFFTLCATWVEWVFFYNEEWRASFFFENLR